MTTQGEERTSQGVEAEQPAPTLSVTVLNYNYARYLPQCLDSILRQTWTDFELILINDCSTDNSLEVIQPYLADPRVKLVNHEHNKGYISSLIEGSELSRGKYITVISADDYCVSDRAFDSLLRPMEADDAVVLAYAAHGHYTPDSVCRYHRRPHPESYVRSGVDEFRDLVLENYILHSGTIIRAVTYRAVGGYDPHARYAPDSVMWMTLCGQGKVAYCADELYAYRVHDQSMSISAAGIRDGLQEGLDGVKRAFVMMQGAAGVGHDLYVRAMKRSLSAVATDNIFASHLRSGWYAYWCAFRIHPVWTVFQTRTLILLARTLLGPHYFASLRAALRRSRHSMQPA
jgi:glycosyltransferase involved in cell wall biosynthesis